VQGYVEGEFVYISSALAGRLDELSVSRGAQVKKGDALFVLECAAEKAQVKEAEQRLAQARANLEDTRKGRRPTEIASLEASLEQSRAAFEFATKELRRQEQLREGGAASAEEYDRARTSYDQSRMQVAQLEADLKTAGLGSRADQIAASEAEAQAREAALAKAAWELGQKRQIAPENALVFDTLYREGEWVPSGRPVAALLPPANMKVRAFVSQEQLSTLQHGQRALVKIDGRDQPVEGTISFISPQAEFTPPVIYSRESRGKLVFMIELVFAPEIGATLHPGQPVDVRLGH